MEKIEFENKLLDAIKKDDLKSFTLLMPTKADLNLCYGRFPILSLLYLYSSFKILSKYEKHLLSIHNFKFVEERNEIYKMFKSKAKKTIRIFSDGEIVFPILMLAVLNERDILKYNFKFLFKNAEINEKLEKIYKLRHNLFVDVKEDVVKISTSKVTFKQTFLFSVISIICCLFIALSSVTMMFIRNNVGFGTDKNPIKISSSQEFFSAIKYGSRTYVIEKDLEIDGSDFVCEDFSGTIIGGEHTVSINGEITTSLIKNFSGKVENLNFKLLDNEIKITQNLGIFAENSSGKILGCNISGNFSGDFNSTEEIFAGVLVSKNSGEISNLEVEVSATLKNSNQSNAYFSAVSGTNDGIISDCKAKPGIVSADTVDISGIACQNYGEILNCDNKVTLIQTSNKEWHPNIAGISIANYGTILNCNNHAELNASSLTEGDSENNYFVFVGGIACENYGEIKNVRNYGDIFAKGKIANVVTGGLVAQNIDNEDGFAGKIISSLSKSNLTVYSEIGQVCVGGVVGLNATSVTNSGFIGIIDADADATENKDVFVSKIEKFATVFAGGVVGINQYSEIHNCYADVDYLAGGSTPVLTEGEDPFKIYAGIVGNVGVYGYIETEMFNPFNPTGTYKTETLSNLHNNYYVEKTEILEKAYGVYAATRSGTISECELTAMTDDVLNSYLGENNLALNKVSSFDNIPLEVLYE